MHKKWNGFHMFGGKKRKYRHTVAQIICGMAIPDDLKNESLKMSEALRGSTDEFFAKEMLPIQAALFIIYQMVQTLYQRRHEQEMALELNYHKRIFISAAANLDREEIRQILTQEVLEEISNMLDEMRNLKAYHASDNTYGDIIDEAKKKQKTLQELVRQSGI